MDDAVALCIPVGTVAIEKSPLKTRFCPLAPEIGETPSNPFRFAADVPTSSQNELA